MPQMSPMNWMVLSMSPILVILQAQIVKTTLFWEKQNNNNYKMKNYVMKWMW